jgi:hypothetical protein
MNDFFNQQKVSTDLINILKYFYEFFKVYKLANNTSVSKWKLADVENSINWAKLIEDLYSKFNKKPYYQKLLNSLKVLSNHWSLNEDDVENIVKNPTFKIRNVSRKSFESSTIYY